MPRLSMIRITGNKYDGFQKQHRDSIFRLSPDREGDHTLFTLQNGSGKGVMMQLISQILLPGTAWGSNKGNKLEGMFYNHRNLFNPYTFHVVLEWKLDGDQDRWLLAGICVRGRWQTRTDREEGEAGVQYFLYTHEYGAEDRYRIEDLPLYDSTREQAVDYEQLEEFIDDNHQDFIKYSKNTVSSLNSEYYQYLASHGIYRSEWEIMRTINRSEGGLDKYFSRARDNQALFDKMLIPAVSESINFRSQEQENSLMNMFISNIQIAEDLPELLSRTDDIHQLQQMVEPLLLDAERGVKLKQARESALSRGDNLYRTLKARQTLLKNELERSRQSREKSKQQRQQLLYEQQNLKYARKLRELKQKQQQHSRLAEDKRKLNNKISELKKRETKLTLNQLYIPYCKYRQQLQQKQERIQAIKDSLGLEDLRGKIDRVRKNMKKSWPGFSEKLKKTSREVDAYKQYLQQQQQQLAAREQELKESIRQLERRVDRFEQRQQDLEQKREQLSKIYNPLQLSSPDYLLEQVTKNRDQAENKLESLQENKQELQTSIQQQREELTQLQLQARELQARTDNLQRKFNHKQQQEQGVFGQLVSQLELDKHTEVYSQSWLSEKQMELEQLLQEKTEKLQELQNQQYELGLDLSLNQEESWIANHDQKQMYRVISEMGIRVYYGSDFLINLAEASQELLDNYPLLPYGLVLMYESDWQRVKDNLEREDLFRSPVPVYINFQMEERGTGGQDFRLVHGRELEFIDKPREFEDWYAGLEQKQGEIAETVKLLQGKIKNLRQLGYTTQQLLEEKSSADLQQQLEQIQERLTGLSNKIESKQKRLDNLQQKQTALTERIDKKQQQLEKIRENYREVKEFARESATLEQKQQKIKGIKQELTGLEQQLQANNSAQTENRELRTGIKHEYKHWQQDLNRFMAEIKGIVPEAELEEQSADESSPGTPDMFDYRESQLNYYYQQLLDLEAREEEKSAELKYLRQQLNQLKQQIQDQQQKMSNIDPEWQEYQLQDSGNTRIRARLKRVRETIATREQERSKIEQEINILTGGIEEKKKEINELFEEIQERFHKTARAWEEVDLDRKQLEIRQGLTENKKYLQDLEEMIEEYEDKTHHLNNLEVRLKIYDLSPDSGEINSLLKEKIRLNPEETVEEWLNDYEEISQKLSELHQQTEADFNDFKHNVSELLENEVLKDKIKENILQDFSYDNYSYNQQILSSFKEYLNNELSQLDEDKAKAERARNQWAERAAMHVMRIINSLQEMINNMVYHNQKGHAFPLVRLRRSDLLPDNEEEIAYELKEYFVNIIDEFNKKGIKVDKLTRSELEQYTGDPALFSRALRGRYPVLEVYKMSEKNEFRYARPRDYYYADWEAVIQGKGDTPEGSGGQSLSINAFMMMMLLNYKKQKLDKSNPWTVLLLDNPFGQASAAHVLDPIFEIADKLNFQIIAFAAPEIVKTEISERFPVFWALEIAGDQSVNGQVIYGERSRKK